MFRPSRWCNDCRGERGEGGSEWQEYVKFEGNLVRAISPYRWFPDTRFPLTDFQRGEFCACEEEYGKTLLQDLEDAGEVAGVEWSGRCQGILTKPEEDRRDGQRSVILRGPSWNGGERAEGHQNGATGGILVTKVQVWIVPSKFKFGER